MINYRKFSLFIFMIGFLLVLPKSYTNILDKQGHPRQEVVDIFRQFKGLLEENKSLLLINNEQSAASLRYVLTEDDFNKILDFQVSAADISLDSLNVIAQKIFLRPANLERKDIVEDDNKFSSYVTNDLWKLFAAIGDIGSIYPTQQKYMYMIINGSTVQNMRQRIQALINLMNESKVQIFPSTQLVFLSGERDLFPEETKAVLLNSAPLLQNPDWKGPATLPVTEDQAAEFIWDQALLPDALRKAQISFVKAKKTEYIDAKTGVKTFKRPTTADTVLKWIADFKPEPGACLAISSQPFVHYQEATTYGIFKKLGLLNKGFTVEAVGFDTVEKSGPFESLSKRAAVYMDNLARTIFTELSNKK